MTAHPGSEWRPAEIVTSLLIRYFLCPNIGQILTQGITGILFSPVVACLKDSFALTMADFRGSDVYTHVCMIVKKKQYYHNCHTTSMFCAVELSRASIAWLVRQNGFRKDHACCQPRVR